MTESYLLQLVSVVPVPSSSFAVWTYSISWSASTSLIHSQSDGPASRRIALELSINIDVKSPDKYPGLPGIQSTRLDRPAQGDVQYVYTDLPDQPISPVRLAFVAPVKQDTFSPARMLQRPAAGLPWTALPMVLSLSDQPALQQIITAPAETPSGLTDPTGGALVLEHASRTIPKATHVPIAVPEEVSGRGLQKRAFVQHLLLQEGEVAAAIRAATLMQAGTSSGSSDLGALASLLRPFERTSTALLPPVASFARVPFGALRAIGQALVALRGHDNPQSGPGRRNALLRAAVAANQSLVANATPFFSDFGMLNLERLEMAPAGIQRGELLATIPLAPAETTAVVQKEWSVTTKEFSSIVTDSLENFSETGVTDNTELAQSTSNQIQHANQFNITGTVSGGIPLISGSTTAAFGAQDSSSQSATDSRKHAVQVTQKASSRTKREHKVTISTTTVTGTSETTTRQLVNPSQTDPIRIDYFSLMRRWRIRLYRYGLRATFDIVIPEPAGQLRKAYAELAKLRDKLGPFEFNIAHFPPGYVRSTSDDNYKAILKLADEKGAQLPPFPEAPPSKTVWTQLDKGDAGAIKDNHTDPINVPDGYWIENLVMHLRLRNRGKARILFCNLPEQEDNNASGGGVDIGPIDLAPLGLGYHQGGAFSVYVSSHDCENSFIEITAVFSPTDLTLNTWLSDAWQALYNAAQAQYFSTQQDIAAKVSAIEDQLNNVDTLTLRREESDEIMKGALRFLLGPGFDFMPGAVDDAIATSSSVKPPDRRFGQVDQVHGVAFTGSDYFMRPLQQLELQDYEGLVRFINQAIEWENVVTFLYSYFWDMPESWEFIRQIKHPDANRQAFLRAGSARVVLTVRKGWEDAWLRFVDGLGPSDTSPRLTIAQEIAEYDSRNYPGIPPANSSEATVRLQDAVYTTTSSQVNGPVDDKVLDLQSADGFTVGARVLVDTGVHIREDKFGWQEEAIVTAISGNSITVKHLQYSHGGDGESYAVVQPGEKGTLIAEWFEYTPTSGTDIAVTSNLQTIA